MTGGRRGTLVSLATFLGWGGAMLRWGALYVEWVWAAYWPYLLSYIGVFGVIGYFTTFYALSGGALAPCVLHPSPAPLRVRCGIAWAGLVGIHNTCHSLAPDSTDHASPDQLGRAFLPSHSRLSQLFSAPGALPSKL
jgi:hypothetical protein